MSVQQSDADGESSEQSRRNVLRKAAGGIGGGALVAGASDPVSAGSYEWSIGYDCGHEECDYLDVNGGFNEYETQFDVYLLGYKAAHHEYNWTKTCTTKTKGFGDSCGNTVSVSVSCCMEYTGNCEWELECSLGYEWESVGSDSHGDSGIIHYCP